MEKEQLQPVIPAAAPREIGTIEPQRIIDVDVYEILMCLSKAKQLYRKVQNGYAQKGVKVFEGTLNDFNTDIDNCISLTTILAGAKLEHIFQKGGII